MAKVNIKPTVNTNFSNSYYCIHSIQKLNSEFDTNVFTSNIPISQLLKNRDILLVDDLKGDARWGMNKIIQRNISNKRVEEIKNEYLETSNRSIKFFPAITIVLLPKTKGEPSSQYNSYNNFFDNIKGIEVEKTYDDENFVYDHPVILKWDKNEISALVIDGQHRVSAIRSFYESKNENSYQDISIPVTYVVFKNDSRIDLIQATRALFIDVNNTPRLVSEEKLIFIDDRNIHRRITAKSLGANDPGNNNEDYYQRMFREDDFLISNDEFINRYLIEESGKDDEESRGFLSNHKTLFPWEISNIMTIHRNILGNILLKYKDVDKTRDIRSICYQLNSVILEEIESAVSMEQIDNTKVKQLFERLSNSGLTDSEIDIFRILIRLKKKNLEEVQQVQSEFFVGTLATPEEDKDRVDFINLLQNVYNQDCAKDNAFELSSNKVTEILHETCEIYILLLTNVFNKLWFAKQIKQSILDYIGEDRKLIFNFIHNAHESLKVGNNNVRRKTDKVDKQINIFLNETEDGPLQRRSKLTEWAKNLEENQKNNLLRTVVGQEMLFLFILPQNVKINQINLDTVISYINELGEIDFFESDYALELKFWDKDEFKVSSFNQWSEIIMKGETMKPGIANATKGANLISLIQKGILNRTNAVANLRVIDSLQKSYGQEVMARITADDSNKLFLIYEEARDADNLHNYLTQNDIDTISEDFENLDSITLKAKNVLIKLLGGMALEQVIIHFKSKL